jgi:hypothetical protein
MSFCIWCASYQSMRLVLATTRSFLHLQERKLPQREILLCTEISLNELSRGTQLFVGTATDCVLVTIFMWNRVRVTLRLTVYRHSVLLGDNPLETHDRWLYFPTKYLRLWTLRNILYDERMCLLVLAITVRYQVWDSRFPNLEGYVPTNWSSQSYVNTVLNLRAP